MAEPVLVRGILATMREFLSWTAATGHGPEDYPKGAGVEGRGRFIGCDPCGSVTTCAPAERCWRGKAEAYWMPAEEMPYRLTVNGAIRTRGTLQEVQAAVADVVTTRLALAGVELAQEAQAIRGAFAEGDVERALAERRQWFTMLDALSDNPIRIKVTYEEDE